MIYAKFKLIKILWWCMIIEEDRCSVLSSSGVLQRSSKPWLAGLHRPVILANVPWVGLIALWERCVLSRAAKVTKAGMIRIRWRIPRPLWCHWEEEVKRRISSLRSNSQLSPEKKSNTGKGQRYLFVIPLSRWLSFRSPWKKSRWQHASMTVRQI